MLYQEIMGTTAKKNQQGGLPVEEVVFPELSVEPCWPGGAEVRVVRE